MLRDVSVYLPNVSERIFHQHKIRNTLSMMCSVKYPTIETLKRRGDFLRLRKGTRYSSKIFTLQADTSDASSTDGVRIGYTVTTKIGNAVTRNRIKRRLREAAKRVMPERAINGYDYVIIAKQGLIDVDFSIIVQELSMSLDRIHANRANGSHK